MFKVSGLINRSYRFKVFVIRSVLSAVVVITIPACILINLLVTGDVWVYSDLCAVTIQVRQLEDGARMDWCSGFVTSTADGRLLFPRRDQQ